MFKKILPYKFNDNEMKPKVSGTAPTPVVQTEVVNRSPKTKVLKNSLKTCTDYTLGDNCFSFCSEKEVTVNITENITEQKYIKNVEGASVLCTGIIDASNVYTNVVTNVSQLAFDVDNGFQVVDLGNGTSKIQMTSSGGVSSLNSLTGAVTLSAGTNVTIGSSGNTLTICSSGGVVSSATPTTLGTTYAYNQTSLCNTYVGYCAGNISNTGINNVAIGQNALKSQISNYTGYGNIAIGKDSLSSFVTGFGNIAIGECSMYCFTSPYGTNIAIGHRALKNRIEGGGNVAIGFEAMSDSVGSPSSGSNVALGSYALRSHKWGHKNIAIGDSSMYGMITGYENVVIGAQALVGYTPWCGDNNVVLGSYGLRNALVANRNIAIGHKAGLCVTTGENNTIIGSLNGPSSLFCTVLIGAGTCERIKVDDTGLYINNSGAGSALSYRNVYEQVDQKTGATGVVTHDFSASSIFYHTSIASNFTVNLTNFNMVTNKATNVVLILIQGLTPYIPTALQINGVAQTINWVGGSVPTGNASAKDIVSFSIINLSSTYTVFGQLTPFS